MPLCVRGDAVRLTQVISNLLNNAGKYTDRPAAAIALRVARDGADVVVTVDRQRRRHPRRHARTRVRPVHAGRERARARARRPRHRPDAGQAARRDARRLRARRQRRRRPRQRVRGSPAGAGRATGADRPTAERHRDATPACAASRAASSSSTTTSTRPRACGARWRCSATTSTSSTTASRRWRRPQRLRPDVVLLDIGLPRLDGYEVARAAARALAGAAGAAAGRDDRARPRRGPRADAAGGLRPPSGQAHRSDVAGIAAGDAAELTAGWIARPDRPLTAQAGRRPSRGAAKGDLMVLSESIEGSRLASNWVGSSPAASRGSSSASWRWRGRARRSCPC